MKRALPLLTLTLLLALLSACAPSSTRSDLIATAQAAPTKVGFFALDTDLAWTYHPEGESIASPALRRRVEGPTVLGSETVTRVRTAGRGLDVSHYYRVEDGVFLLREDRPGARITYDPPMQIYPDAEQLGPGVSWSGTTTATVRFPEAPADRGTTQVEVTYDYRVIDERTVETAAGMFPVHVINLTATDPTQESEQVSEQLWFTPYLGEVRTRNGWVLTDANALRTERDLPPTPVTTP